MKKKFLALVLAAVCTTVAGCGGNGTTTTQETDTTNQTTEDSTHPNELFIGIPQDLDQSLDPHKTEGAGTREVMFNIFEGLVKPTPSGDFIPAVAENYVISDDHLTYTFHLRPNIQFHNGDTVTSEDVRYSIQRCADATETGVRQVEAFSSIASMETPEEQTIIITLTEPNNEFLSYLTTAIIPADYTEQDTKPIGTGPFKFISRTAQDSIIFERFEDYWGTPAHLDKVTIRIIENPDSVLMSLESGAVDLYPRLTTARAAQLSDNFNVVEGASNYAQALYLNNAVEPLTDVRVRQALCYGTDKYGVIDIAFDGHGSPLGSSMYPTFAKYFDDSLTDYYTRDVEKAKELLTEAGYPDGFSMTITVPSNYQLHIDTAQVLVEQLKDIGVNAEIQTVEWGTWLDDVYAGRNFQSTVVGVDAKNITASSMLKRFVSTATDNFINYNNEEYDRLFEQAQITFDDAEQTAIYKQMERNLTENAANVYLQDTANMTAMRKGLEGLQFYPIYVLDLAALYWTT